MPDPTTRLRLMRITPGSDNNVWGQRQNENTLDLVDEAIAGVERISLTGNNGSLTLTSANYVSDLSRNAALVFYGTPTVNVAVSIPAVEKVYVVSNTTSKDVTLSAGGAGVTLSAGDRAVVWCDGTDCGFGSISAQTVNGLIANAQLAGANLPGQAGNQGRFLKTDGAVPLWADVPNPDVGGGADATITTSATLSNTASVVQSVDMASNAQSVRLPDATTLTKGGRKFVILNVGNRTAGVRDNAGTLLTVVPAGAAAELHLRDNATAAGSWGVTGRGLEPALTLIDHTAPTTVTAALETAVRLTDTLSLHFGTTASGFNALAVDSGAGLAGTWTAVEATAAANVSHAFRVSDTQAIVFWTAVGNHRTAVLTVDPATRAITAGSTQTMPSAYLTQVTFSGRPIIAQLTPTLFVIAPLLGASQQALAVMVSGSSVTLGAGVVVSASGQQILACYRISDTQALAIYVDDSGTAGIPFSIRAAVLSVSGTTVTVGPSAGINDVVASGLLPTCQLSATKYVVSYGSYATGFPLAVVITVSGTTVSFGAPLTVESTNSTDSLLSSTLYEANRFQPNLYRVSDTQAVMTWGRAASGVSRHAVLTESGGSLTVGNTLFSLWGNSTGGNFPQTPAGFLAFSTAAEEMAVFSVTINGTALDVSGTFVDGGMIFAPEAGRRFGLSGGAFGIAQSGTGVLSRYSLLHLFKFAPFGPPRYLGRLVRNNAVISSALTPVEIAPNKVALISGQGLTQPAATGDNVRLQIVEFASA